MSRTRRTERVLPSRLRQPIKAGLHRLGQWLVHLTGDAPPPRPHPLCALVASGAVHPSARFEAASVVMTRECRVCLGAEAMLCGRVIFHRGGEFVLGARSYVGAETEIRITTSVVIGDDVMIAWGCTLMDTDMHALRFDERAKDVLIEGRQRGLTHADKDWSVVRCAPIRVGDKAWIGMRSIVLPGVTLGEGCIVGAGSVVTKDVPAWTIVAGNPARVVRELNAGERGAVLAGESLCAGSRSAGMRARIPRCARNDSELARHDGGRARADGRREGEAG